MLCSIRYPSTTAQECARSASPARGAIATFVQQLKSDSKADLGIYWVAEILAVRGHNMASRIAVSLSLVLVLIVGVNAFGQTVALPQPVAVAKDAEGKVVTQVSGVTFEDSAGMALAILNVDGIPACFRITFEGLRACADSPLYFSEPNCTGDMFVKSPAITGIEAITHIKVVVIGPHQTLGTYRVFRSLPGPTVNINYDSYQTVYSGCINVPGGPILVNAAAEVLPNPLEGFHGPSDAYPDQEWTIEGGDLIH